MKRTNTRFGFSAARWIASVFGVLGGLGGLVHGIGETLQGNIPPDGIIIDSWVQGPIATHMGGEPGMTVIPNLLVTGILTIVFSLALAGWAMAFVHRRHGGLVQLLLSLGMLLVGGGFGPPIIAILASVAGLGIGASHNRWRARLPHGLQRLLALLWPWLFGVRVADGVFLVIGSLVLVYGFDVNNPDLFTMSFFSVVVLLLLTLVVGVAFDILKTREPQHV